MSSETSTESQPLTHHREAAAFEPWQLFTLAGLIGATIAVFMARGESPSAVILISLTIFAAAAVGIAALRTFLPLTEKSLKGTAQVLGGRTRGALEREKALALRSIKELEFDRAMGKVSEKDFVEMSARLRARATRLIRQLDAGTGYLTEIEREIEKRIGAPSSPVAGPRAHDPVHVSEEMPAGEAAARSLAAEAQAAGQVVPSGAAASACASCGQSNDADARFCKHCGHAMEQKS